MARDVNTAWTRWSVALALVGLAHLGLWYAVTHADDDVTPARPLPTVYVSLLAPAEPPKPAPQAPQPPRHEAKPQPQPGPPPKRAAQPAAEPVPAKEAAPQSAPDATAPPAAPTPGATVSTAAAQAAPEPVFEAPRYNAAYLNNPPPPYPVMARRRGIEGTVLVRAEINTEGACNRAELRKSSGSDTLDQAALEAVRKWRFVPAKKGNQTLVAWVDIPITFKLEN